jgi:membrane associated rhomboid family serine protease
MTRASPPSHRSTRWGQIVVWGIVVITCLPEIVLQLSERGILGQPIWRVLAYQNGAFWPGLLDSWRPNYPAQPVTMFLSYSGLHVSLPHLLGNMLALVVLAQFLAPVTLMGGLRFAGVYLGSAFGAAAGFALIYTGSGSMVGASGAIFGMAGAAITWRWRQRRQAEPREALMEAGGYALALAVLNAASHVLQDGPVAWEAHMGGALTGALLALVVAAPGAGPVRGQTFRK